jgi:hypothetical protein
LVALQSDGRATFVAGFKQWLALGYCVKRGSRAIRIMAPMPVKARDGETGEKTDETITLFKAVAVFFQEQVEPLASGEPTPIEPLSEPLTGDSHAHLLPRLTGFCESLGYSVSFEAIDGLAGGWCDPEAKRIVVDAGVAPNARLRTLVPWRRWRIRTFGMPGERSLPKCLLPESVGGVPRLSRGLATVVAEPRA